MIMISMIMIIIITIIIIKTVKKTCRFIVGSVRDSEVINPTANT